MKKNFCNPINMNYRYQFNRDIRSGLIHINREAADPSMILFKGIYYMFASMTLSVWVSDDMVHWKSRRLPDYLPLYGYAPDIRIIGEYAYFCSNRERGICDFYRTKDLLNGPYEKIEGSFHFQDPNLFADEDGRVYFYWGLSNETPIYGVELDPRSMRPIGKRRELIWSDPYHKGFERTGEDNTFLPGGHEPKRLIHAPYIEGAWMNKYGGKYYLQYAFAGTEYNIYGDGVYVSGQPLGPFTLARNNPYSYKPGGFCPEAGHGSTMRDDEHNLWHTATMRISVNHRFERRIGIWPAGIDLEGELFCNQRYGDWPIAVEAGNMDPWRNPEWYLLSYNKPIRASSFEENNPPEKAADENVQTWWRAAGNAPGEWLELDLQKPYTVHAVQINFADDRINAHAADELFRSEHHRYFEESEQVTRWILQGSRDGSTYFVIADKSAANTDLPHDFV